MKRLWISVLVLLLLFSAALLSNRTLCRMTSEITDLLEQAEAQYQAGDSAQARALLIAAQQDCEELYIREGAAPVSTVVNDCISHESMV